jgi:cysteinyl-tRNA synthetase
VTECLTLSDSVSAKVAWPNISDEQIAKLIDDRNAARARRDWAAADAIRKQLTDAGVTIEDRPDGTTRIKR